MSNEELEFISGTEMQRLIVQRMKETNTRIFDTINSKIGKNISVIKS